MQLGKDANGRTVALPVGRSIELELDENPTTGYRWQIVGSGEPNCTLIDNRFLVASGPAGKGGVHRWIFEARQPGTATVTLHSQRRWSSSEEPPRQIFTLHLAIEDGERRD